MSHAGSLIGLKLTCTLLNPGCSPVSSLAFHQASRMYIGERGCVSESSIRLTSPDQDGRRNTISRPCSSLVETSSIPKETEGSNIPSDPVLVSASHSTTPESRTDEIRTTEGCSSLWSRNRSLFKLASSASSAAAFSSHGGE